MNSIRLAARLALGLLGIAAGVAEAQVKGQTDIHHIHGLAIDRRDPEALLIATHTGLVRLRPAGAEWLGEHRFDLMGFTAHPREPNVAYASGHPDLPTYAREQVGNLGLLLTRDGGRTWQSVALRGHADFHALTYSPRAGGRLYGWNVAGEQSGLYRVSTREWKVERLAASGLMNVLALSAAPTEDGPLLAGTMKGLFVSRDQGETWQAVKGLSADAPVTAVSHGPSPTKVVYAYVHQAGRGLARSPDGGVSWGAPVLFTGAQTPVIALAVGPAEQVVVATTGADVMRSRDGGRRWETLVQHGRPVGARR